MQAQYVGHKRSDANDASTVPKLCGVRAGHRPPVANDYADIELQIKLRSG